MGCVEADFSQLPPDLPVPEDDGAADHLTGMALPRLSLPSTLGGAINLAAATTAPDVGSTTPGVASTPPDVAFPAGAERKARHLIVYVYPRTGAPGEPLLPGWDDIPGARGCTPQSCAYRDSLAELTSLGAAVIGVSAQAPDEQREFAAREHIPFPLLSDSGLELATELRLPTFEAAGMTLYKRLTLVAAGGTITKVFYPVFPPDRDPAEVLAWLRGSGHPPKEFEL
jgi:peroxiredoxin